MEDFIDELEDMEASLDFDKSLVFEGREDEVTNILNTFSRTDSSKEIGSQLFKEDTFNVSIHSFRSFFPDAYISTVAQHNFKVILLSSLLSISMCI